MVAVKRKSREEALEKAASIWRGNAYQRGEIQDPHFDLCFRSMDPIDSDFERFAGEVFEPMLRSMKEITADG
jgi:hypothetical protein